MDNPRRSRPEMLASQLSGRVISGSTLQALHDRFAPQRISAVDKYRGACVSTMPFRLIR